MTGGKYSVRPGGRISSMEREDTAEADKLSLVPSEDAAQIGAEYWKNQCDYWQRKALEEKEKFQLLPLGRFKAFVESHRILRQLLLSYFGLLSSPLVVTDVSLITGPHQHLQEPSHGDEQSLYWYNKSRNYKYVASEYAKLNRRIDDSLFLKSLAWLWKSITVDKHFISHVGVLTGMSRERASLGRPGPDLISVIMPTYNRAYCLGYAIESLLAQSYENWELIIVDDGSTDSTGTFVRKFRDERISFYSIPRSGVSKARNVGLGLAEGAYITFLDSDNLLHPDFLKDMHGMISLSDSSVGFVHCDYFVYQNGRRIGRHSGECSTSVLFRKPLIDLGAIMCKREAFHDGNVVFNENMDKWVDYELILRLDAQWNHKHVKKALMHYFRLEDGISLSLDTQRDFTRNMSLIRKTKNNLLKVGYVLWDYPVLSQTFVHSEIEWLLKHGVDVKVYYKTEPDKEATLTYEADKHQVATAAQLTSLARKHKRNVLHAHFAYPSGNLLAWPAAEKGSILFTLMPHAVDIFAYANEKKNNLKRMANSPLCKALFAYGPFHRDYYLQHGVPDKKIVIKPNAMDPLWLEETLEFSDAPIRKVLFVGRFIEKKGMADLIAVARKVQDMNLEFNVYGYGPLQGEVQRAAGDMSNITIHPDGIPHTEMRKVMKDADLFFLPCVRASNGDMDGLPQVLLEAAVSGVPILTTNLSSIPVLVEEGVTGFAGPPGDREWLEQRLRELAGKSKKDLEDMLTAARSRAIELFHPDRVHRRLMETWTI